MRPFRVVLTTSVFLVMAFAVRANEKPTEAYQQAMKDLGAANASLRKDVQAIEAAGAYPDYNPIEKEAATFKTAFTTAISYWNGRKVDDAIKLAQAGVTHADELEAARKDRNYDALMTAAAEIGKTCGSCHTAHRERLPDGTFEVK